MKISLKWLNEYVDVKDFFLKAEVLAETLTRAGLEVENIENRARDYEFVVTGLILEKDKHPNADKLSLCRVTTGEGVVHQIVCGAQNHKANDRVIVALPGAVLPGNFAIKKAVVRGVDSGGMLCSYKELGLEQTQEVDGIVILPESAPIGKSLSEYLGLDDITFELKVTPNRADCLSHYGLAREVACLLGRPLLAIEPKPESKPESSPEAKAETKSKFSEETASRQFQIEILAQDLCPRYTGRIISGVKIADSPDWLKKRLETVGLKSINNVVDCTNYVMMEMGQPLHAFDAATIGGGKIIVDRAQAGEKFVSLDGTELILTGEELMIKDGQRSLCMAGVIGGKSSGVSQGTSDLFLEAAYFSPQSARKSSRKHGLNTDSGYRFSRGVDPNNTRKALDRATELILQVAGGQAAQQVFDSNSEPVKKHKISISIQTISDRMGYTCEAAKFVDFMRRLGCDISESGDDNFTVLPPSFRFDLEGEMDLVEEYARLFGYDQIPETLRATPMIPASHDLQYEMSRRVIDSLVAGGYQQAVNFSFLGEVAEKNFIKRFENLSKSGLSASEPAIRLLNPLNEEMNVMRSSLAFGLFRNCVQNFHQSNEYGRLFEAGKTFSRKEDGVHQEHWRVGLIGWGYNQGLWHQAPQHPLVFELKTAIEDILRKLKIANFSWVQASDRGETLDFLHKGQFAVLVVEGKKVGYLGTLHPVLQDEHKIRAPVAMAEFDLDALVKGQPRPFRVQSISRLPAVQRDLALLMPKVLKAGEVAKEIRKEGGALLTAVSIFDLYEGEKLPVGQKSVAFRLTFHDLNATLQDSSVNESIEKVLGALKKKFEITVR